MKALPLGPVIAAAALLALGVACGSSDDAADATSFCADVATVLNGCTLSSECKADIGAVCPSALAPRVSAAYDTALHACASTEADCNLDPGYDTCLFAKVTAATATTAQSKLAADFCAACAPGSTVQAGAPDGLNCSGHAVTLPQGFGSVLGVYVLELSDSAAASAESCVAPAQAAYPNDYDNCENMFLGCISQQEQQAEGAKVASACTSGGGAVSDGGT